MNIPAPLLERLASEAEATANPADEQTLSLLRERNISGDALNYFRDFNFAASVDLVNLDTAKDNLDMMDTVTPNCEVWQHGFIPFASDFEGRIYCFNQNDRDALGNSKIVRLQYTFGDDTSVADISAAAKHIASDFNAFLELYLDSKVDSI